MDVIHESDCLKEFSKIQEPDLRISFWQGAPEELLRSLHTSLDQIKLADYVDLNVRKEFEKSKNIVLFSFYSYSMSSVAVLHSYACIEKAIILKALKLRLITEDIKSKDKSLLFGGSGLRRKIGFALERKWLGRKHFYLFDSDEMDHSDEGFSLRLDSWLDMRNSLAHNPAFLNILWRVPEQLRLFANMINAISFSDHEYNEVIPEINLPKQQQCVSATALILTGQKRLLKFVPVRS